MEYASAQAAEVGSSHIQGRGLFAKRDFHKGDLVLGWNPNNRYLSEEEVQNLPDEEKRYVAIHNDKYLLIAEPERYMNHSCDPNTQVDQDGLDYTLKDINAGEEITGDYLYEGVLVGFECKCGSSNCRRYIPDW